MSTKHAHFHWTVYAAAAIALFSLAVKAFSAITGHTLISTFCIGNSEPYVFGACISILAIVVLALLLWRKKGVYYVLYAILLLLLFFAYIPWKSNIAYSYLLGRNAPALFEGLILLTIALFFKKGGRSGWNTLFSAAKPNINLRPVIITGSAILAGCLALCIIVSSKEYPDYVTSFKDKLCGCFRIPGRYQVLNAIF